MAQKSRIELGTPRALRDTAASIHHNSWRGGEHKLWKFSNEIIPSSLGLRLPKEEYATWGNMIENLPYALPISMVFWNPTVRDRVRINIIQLISGMYICPCMSLEVCTTFTQGKQPSAWHCLMMENVAEMTAWLPTIDAKVATTNTGQNTGSVQKKPLNHINTRSLMMHTTAMRSRCDKNLIWEHRKLIAPI